MAKQNTNKTSWQRETSAHLFLSLFHIKFVIIENYGESSQQITEKHMSCVR